MMYQFLNINNSANASGERRCDNKESKGTGVRNAGVL